MYLHTLGKTYAQALCLVNISFNLGELRLGLTQQNNNFLIPTFRVPWTNLFSQLCTYYYNRGWIGIFGKRRFNIKIDIFPGWPRTNIEYFTLGQEQNMSIFGLGRASFKIVHYNNILFDAM